VAVYAGGARTTAAPTNLLPAISLYATAAVGFSILEVGISNTTATACVVGLCRLTTAGTQGAAITEASLGQAGVANSCTMVNSHTSTGPTLIDLGYRWSLGAAIGSGVIWTFLNGEVEVNIGTGNGFGVFCPTGTGQVLDVYMKWYEG
jgi:hypothetical protein